MRKLLNLTLVVAFGLAIAFTGCKKYEEGPTLSLATKKGRIVNTWKFEKVIANGQDVTSAYMTLWPDYSIEYKRDNTYIKSYGGSSAYIGTWDFDTKKENLILTPNGSSSANKAEILRLKSAELWLKEVDGTDVIEFHHVTK